MTEIHADLHTHSTFSDGRLSPGELAAAVAKTTLKAVALTDHDTVEGCTPFLEAAHTAGLHGIPGVELSTTLDRREIHLLGLGVDLHDNMLHDELDRIRRARVRRAEKIVDRLERDRIVLDFGEIRAFAKGGVITRPHIARAMVRAGYVRDIGSAFEKYLADGLPAAVPKDFLTPAEGIALLHGAGAFVSVAHPGINVTADLLAGMRAGGLDGLEVWHPKHPPRIAEELEETARRLDLLPTGGSDYHGIELGFQLLGRFGLTRERYERVAARFSS